jgi:hypothetical protein
MQQFNEINVEVVSPFVTDDSFQGKHPKAVGTCRFQGMEAEMAAFGAKKLERLGQLREGDVFTASVKENDYGWMVADLGMPGGNGAPQQAAPQQQQQAAPRTAAPTRIDPMTTAQQTMVPLLGGLFTAFADIVDKTYGKDVGYEVDRGEIAEKLAVAAFIAVTRG